MPSNYDGNATGVETPSVAPGYGSTITVAIPVDGDANNAATLFNQPLRVFADWVQFICNAIVVGLVGLTRILPQMVWGDALGRYRTLIDHNGYLMGRNTIVDENWCYTIGTVSSSATPVVAAQKWSAGLGSGSPTVTITDPSSTYPSLYVDLFSNPSSGTSRSVIYSTRKVVNSANTFQSIVLEFEAGQSVSGPAADGANALDFYCGIADNPIPASAANYCWFHYNAKDHDTWYAEVANSSTATSQDTAVLAGFSAANPAIRFRVELHGSTSTYGAAKAKFYVNDALTNTVTTNTPAAGVMYIVFAAVNGGTSSFPIHLYVGPPKLVMNRFQSNPAL